MEAFDDEEHEQLHLQKKDAAGAASTFKRSCRSSSWNVYVASDLPRASGMSSSSALVVAADLLACHAPAPDVRFAARLRKRIDEVFPQQFVKNKNCTTMYRYPPWLFTYLGCCENGSACAVPAPA